MEQNNFHESSTNLKENEHSMMPKLSSSTLQNLQIDKLKELKVDNLTRPNFVSNNNVPLDANNHQFKTMPFHQNLTNLGKSGQDFDQLSAMA